MTGLREYAQLYYAPDQQFNTGLAALERNLWDKAARCFAAVVQARPNDAEALSCWAYAALKLGHFDQALGLLVDAQAITDTPALNAQFEYTLARCEVHDIGVEKAWVELAADLRDGLIALNRTLSTLEKSR
jgi:tetratricopeptide (TPR) repeat protein